MHGAIYTGKYIMYGVCFSILENMKHSHPGVQEKGGEGSMRQWLCQHISYTPAWKCKTVMGAGTYIQEHTVHITHLFCAQNVVKCTHLCMQTPWVLYNSSSLSHSILGAVSLHCLSQTTSHSNPNIIPFPISPSYPRTRPHRPRLYICQEHS